MAYKLAAEPREKSANQLSTLRKDEKIPGILYGVGVKENLMVKFPKLAFQKLYEEAGESQVVELELGSDKPVNVLVRDVQIHPVSRDVIHVDFQAIDVTKPAEIEVPLEFTGEAPAVKASGGSLVKKINSIPVKCLPKDFVKFIEVPLGKLETLEDTILIQDLEIPESFTLMTDEHDLVATVVPPRIEAEPAPAEEVEGEQGEAAGEEGGEEKPAEEAPAEGEAKE
jgi:large subunit ribosomal protein L25